jgi:hypothetical protein
MNPEQAGRRWQERRVAEKRRDVELETFPTTAGGASKVAHPMFGVGGAELRPPPSCQLLFPVFESGS